MTERFNKLEKNEETENDEALQKIKELKNRGDFNSIGKQLFSDLKEKLFEPLREKFHKKYPELDCDNITDEKFPKDYDQALEEAWEIFCKTVKNKSETEILDRAKEIYQFDMNNENFVHAYEIANGFLDQKSVQKAGGKALEVVYQKMKKSENETEKLNAANELLSSLFVPKIERPDKMVEEILIALIQSKETKENPNGIYMKIKQKLLLGNKNWHLPKNDVIFNFVHPLARTEIEKLIEVKRKEESLKRAQSFEQIGFLDLEADGDLFEKLTG